MRYFGTPELIWTGLQTDYDLEEAREHLRARLNVTCAVEEPDMDCVFRLGNSTRGAKGGAFFRENVSVRRRFSNIYQLVN